MKTYKTSDLIANRGFRTQAISHIMGNKDFDDLSSKWCKAQEPLQETIEVELKIGGKEYDLFHILDVIEKSMDGLVAQKSKEQLESKFRGMMNMIVEIDENLGKIHRELDEMED